MVWGTRVPSTAGNEGRNGTERINKKADSAALVLNGHKKNIELGLLPVKLEDKYKLSPNGNVHPLKTTEEFRKKLDRKPCEITKGQMEAAKEKLLEFLHLNGNGKKNGFEGKLLDGAVTPMTQKQALELAYYYYLKVLWKSDSANPDLLMEMKSCQPDFRETIAAMEALPELEKEKAKEFYDAARRQAIRAAHMLLEKRRRLDSEIMQLGSAQKKELGLQEEHRMRMMTAIAEKYANRKGTWGSIMEKKAPPLSKILAYAAPLGVAIAAVAEGVPLGYVTLGLFGAWLLIFGAKNFVIDPILASWRDKTKVTAEKEKAKASVQISEMEDEIRAEYAMRISKSRQEFDKGKKEIMAGLKDAYEQLLYEHGYARRG